MRVELLDHMGSDDAVCDAARVSMDRRADQFPPEKNRSLIRYLARNQHWTPFAHCVAKFRVTAPIIVRAQLWKHVVGLGIAPDLPMNEVSRRYVDSPPEFYRPDGWRARAENVKQGSADHCVDAWWLADAYDALCRKSRELYDDMLANGVAPEMARMVLLQSTMTQWIWTGSLAAWARVCRLRLDGHAQAETREIAGLIAAHMQGLFPASWAALMGDAP